jgi:ADP-dependent NAD(P)H-hydrate dehydratase
MHHKILSNYLPDTSAPSAVTVGDGLTSTAVYKLVTVQDLNRLLKPRKSFSHKGTYGHALIVAGQEQTMGAALLCATGCLYAGAGLTTASIPVSGLTALNTALPEVMYLSREAIEDPSKLEKFSCIAIGPGLGKDEPVAALLEAAFAVKKPLVVDADAINLLAKEPEQLSRVPAGSVFTPHVKEFDGLFGEHHTWFHRIQTAREMAKKHQIVIVLKNEYTFIIDQRSNVFINQTGNAAMAQGGMGDVLTGMIVALIAQGYSSADAAVLAVSVHGSSGDALAATRFVVTASQVAKHVPVILRNIIK